MFLSKQLVSPDDSSLLRPASISFGWLEVDGMHEFLKKRVQVAENRMERAKSLENRANDTRRPREVTSCRARH